MLPMPPSTTMTRMMVETVNWNMSGVAVVSLATWNVPAMRADRRADGEREQLVVDVVDAHRAGGKLVLAQRQPGAAGARVLQAIADEDDQRDERQDQVVERLARRTRS